MRTVGILSLCISICFLASSCIPDAIPEEPAAQQEVPGNNGSSVPETPKQPEGSMTIKITVGSNVFKADIENSETGKALLEKLPLTLEMSELNGNEKYCYGVSLPRKDKHFGSLSAGDLMLYSGNCIVLFYGSAGGYNYTRIGKLQSTDGLAKALGSGSVTIRFEKEPQD